MSSFQSPSNMILSPRKIQFCSFEPKSSQNLLIGLSLRIANCWEYTVLIPFPEPEGLYADMTLVFVPLVPLSRDHDHLPKLDSSLPDVHVIARLPLVIKHVPPRWSRDALGSVLLQPTAMLQCSNHGETLLHILSFSSNIDHFTFVSVILIMSISFSSMNVRISLSLMECRSRPRLFTLRVQMRTDLCVLLFILSPHHSFR